MVSIPRSTSRTLFNSRSKTTKSRQPAPKARHRLISLLLGRSPEDSQPEAIEEATKWLDSTLDKLEGKPNPEKK